MKMFSPFESTDPAASVTCAVKENPDPLVAVGMPVIAPPELRVRPGGSVPPVGVHVKGAVPPLAKREKLYPGKFRSHWGSGEPDPTVTAGLMVIWSARLTTAPALSLTWAVKPKVPAAEGVPASAPVFTLRPMPVGRAPEAME